jgi:hypothetical protein
MPEGQPDHYLFSHAQAAGYPLPLCYPLYFQRLCFHFFLLAITESRRQGAAVSGFRLTADLRLACLAVVEFHKIYVTNYVVADVIVFRTFGPSWADEASGFRSKSMPALRFCFCALLGLLTVGASARAQNFTQNLIHTFTMSPDGAGPNPIFRDAQGNLYGTTTSGGLSSCQNGGGAGCGIVFEVSSSGEYSVLYSFKGNLDGNTPSPELLKTLLATYLAQPGAAMAALGPSSSWTLAAMKRRFISSVLSRVGDTLILPRPSTRRAISTAPRTMAAIPTVDLTETAVGLSMK